MTYEQYVNQARANNVEPLSEAEWNNQNGFRDETGSSVNPESGASIRNQYDTATANNDKQSADNAMNAARQIQDSTIDKAALKSEKVKPTVGQPKSRAGLNEAQASFDDKIERTANERSNKAKAGFDKLKSSVKANFEDREAKTRQANDSMSDLIAKAYQGEQLSSEDINSLLDNYKFLQEELETKGPSAGTQVMNLASAISALASLQSGGEFQPIDFSQYGMAKDKEDKEMFRNNLNNLSNQISDLFGKSKIDTAQGAAQAAETNAADTKQIAADETNALNQIEENSLATELGIDADKAKYIDESEYMKLKDAVSSASAENFALFQHELSEFARQVGLSNDVAFMQSLKDPNQVINALAKMGQAAAARDTGNGAMMQNFNKLLTVGNGLLGMAGSAAALSDKNVKSYLLNIKL